MEIKQLRYFKRVADAGSVSRAAAALSVAQPAVSRQIANLEETLGTPLFFRNGRGVTLTDAGTQLYGHTAEILEAIRQAEQNVRETVGVARGHLLIGAPPTVVRHLAPPLVRQIARHHPQVDLEFTEGSSGYVNEWLSNGLLDIAVLHDATRTQHFLTEPLLREALVLVTGPASGEGVTGLLGETAALSALACHRLVLPRRAHGLRLLLERVAIQARLTLDVAAEVDGLAAAKAMVREDGLASVLPRGSVTPADGLVVRCVAGFEEGRPLSRTLLLATSSQRPVSQTTRLVINAVKSVVRTLLDEGAWPGAERYADRSPVAPGAEALARRPDAPSPTGLGHAA